MVDPVIDLSNRTLLRDGDIIVLCTDGLWGPVPSDEIATWLTSTPILKAAPEMMREAERRGGDGRRQPLRDHRSLGAGDARSTSRRRRSPKRCRSASSRHRLDSTLPLADRKGGRTRPVRRRDRARDRRDPDDDPPLPALRFPEFGVSFAAVRRRRDRADRGRRRSARATSHAPDHHRHRDHGARPEAGPPDHRARRARGRQSQGDRPRRCTSESTPSARSTPRATEVHGMTWDDLKGKPRFRGRRRGIHRLRPEARNGSSTTRRSTSGSWTASSSRRCLPACADIHAGVIDTLALAREMFPGKRNSLDALCERFSVDNAQRSVHGALLDAQLLAEVYLTMTRGQETLTIDMAPAPALSLDPSGGDGRSVRRAQDRGNDRAVGRRARGAPGISRCCSTGNRPGAASGSRSRRSMRIRPPCNALAAA